MLNGRNHTARANGHAAGANGLVVNGRGHPASADTESSIFYGEYEQKLASELAELLKTGSAPRIPAEVVPPDSPTVAASKALRPAVAGGDNLAPSGLPQMARRLAPQPQRTFVAATRPRNDFALTDEDEPPLPFSWKHEPRPPQPSWLAKQLRAGLVGLGAGLMVVLPAVAVLTGRLDGWMPSRTGQEQVAMAAASSRAAPTATVAADQPVEGRAQPLERSKTETAPFMTRAQAPALARVESVDPAVTVRSVGSVGAFPLAAQRPEVADPPIMAAITLPVTPRSAETFASPPRPATPVNDAGDLLTAGLRLVKDGDIAGARGPLAKAAALGHADAMLALGETYDPNMLAAWAARDVKPDVSAARLHYGQAVAAGSTRAKNRLDALN